MYLIDTNVISELRKRKSANPNVVAFFTESHFECSLLLAKLSAVLRELDHPCPSRGGE